MAVAVALWSTVVKPGAELEEVAPPHDIRVTNVALGDELADESGRTVVKLIHMQPVAPDTDDEDEEDDEEVHQEPVETVLCSLIPGKIEQVQLDITLQAGETIAFNITGKNTVYLTGNFVDQRPFDLPPDEDELMSDDEEEALRLEDVSSDVEVPADEADELMDDSDDDEAPQLLPPPSKAASKKRAREEDVAAPPQPSKKEKKQRNKKLKAADGEAVPAGKPAAPEPKKEESKPAEATGEKKDKKKKKKKGKGGQAGQGQ